MQTRQTILLFGWKKEKSRVQEFQSKIKPKKKKKKLKYEGRV